MHLTYKSSNEDIVARALMTCSTCCTSNLRLAASNRSFNNTWSFSVIGILLIEVVLGSCDNVDDIISFKKAMATEL